MISIYEMPLVETLYELHITNLQNLFVMQDWYFWTEFLGFSTALSAQFYAIRISEFYMRYNPSLSILKNE